jgi:tetratricopeptide (TPR) repeat protein
MTQPDDDTAAATAHADAKPDRAGLPPALADCPGAMPDPNDSSERPCSANCSRAPPAPVSVPLPTPLHEAMALHRAGQLEQAARRYEAILEVQPAHLDALHLLGVLAAQSGDHRRAAELIAKAIAIDPAHAVLHRNLGLAQRGLGRAELAIASFERAVALKPDYAEAWNNLGNALREVHQPARALECYDRTLALRSRFAEAHYNRAMALLDLRRLDRALESFDRALAIKPDFVEAWNNRGKALKELGRLDAAIASYDHAIALRPEHANAQWNKALALLMAGRYEEGWPLYEWGWATGERGPRRAFAQPLWRGAEPLRGKRILLAAEQGFGDTIQFCRYAGLVAAMGGEVILEVPPPLHELMKTLDGPARVIVAGSDLPAFDYHCPLLSLPAALRTTLATVPARAAYLRSDPSKKKSWEALLGPQTRPRVGICWSSLSTYREDGKRSMALSTFVRGLPESGVELICLQQQIKESDRATLAERPHVRFFGDRFHDFSDTAALIANLDVVVSTCTSVAHLSCALGKPTWLLLAFVPDYRWMLGRDDTPWYPTARLYRQRRIDDWSDALSSVRADLGAHLW